MTTITIIFLIIGIILTCAIFAYIGYTIALLIYDPKALMESSKKLLEVNNQLQAANHEFAEVNKKMDETIKSNTNWYLQNINALGQYLKDKHNDNYVFDQLKNMQGIEPRIDIVYDVDIILDKLKVGGWDSLTPEEISFLKSQGKS